MILHILTSETSSLSCAVEPSAQTLKLIYLRVCVCVCVCVCVSLTRFSPDEPRDRFLPHWQWTTPVETDGEKASVFSLPDPRGATEGPRHLTASLSTSHNHNSKVTWHLCVCVCVCVFVRWVRTRSQRGSTSPSCLFVPLTQQGSEVNRGRGRG